MTLNDEDLSAVCTSVERGLDGQAAMHKRAVRPRNRRTLSVYQPYLRTVSDSSISKVRICIIPKLPVVSTEQHVARYALNTYASHVCLLRQWHY